MLEFLGGGRTSRLLLVLFCFLFYGTVATAQSFLITKTVLDSIKPGSFHGSGQLGLEFKQSDSRGFSLNAGVNLSVPTSKHQFKLDGHFVYNLLDNYSNDNKGYVCFDAHLFQFNKNGETGKLEKTPYYYELFASFNYDYVRDLKARFMGGFKFVFQPLREHPHICVEPGIGLLFSYQNWQVLNPGTGPNSNNYQLADYNAIRNLELPSGGTVNDYLGISEDGTKEQIDPRLALSATVFGVWPRIEFNAYLIVQQPMLRPFVNNPDKDAEVRQLAFDYDISQGIVPESSAHDNALNNICAPEILLGGNFKVKIWKMLSLVTTVEFFYDAGQLGCHSRNLTYCLREGISVSW